MITANTRPIFHVTADQPQLIGQRLDAAEKLAQERASERAVTEFS
jgi:hypothetical protein